jgi:hypothetical protein
MPIKLCKRLIKINAWGCALGEKGVSVLLLNILSAMVKHNNVIVNVHLRKHWQRRTKTHFNQPAQKVKRN